MNQTTTPGAARSAILWNRLRTFLSKPHNVILLLMGIVVTITTIAPIVAIVEDTFKIHPGTIDAHLTGQTAGYTLVNYIDLFTDTRVLNSYLFTFKVAIVATILTNVISLTLAIGLSSKIKFKSALRGVYFVPRILGGLVVGYVFSYFFTYILPARGRAGVAGVRADHDHLHHRPLLSARRRVRGGRA